MDALTKKPILAVLLIAANLLIEPEKILYF